METFRGKVAVVTGAASGLGYGLAERFGAEGMRVAVADVDESGLVAAAAAVDAAGGEAMAIRTDVADQASVDALADAVYDRFGAAHVVCNNAGVQTLGTIWEASLEDWEWCLGVNLWGVVHGIRSFVPRMLAAGEEGHVVNTASTAGLVAGGIMAKWRLGIYAATKHAVVAITETLHAELSMEGSKIGATVLCPSAIRSRIWDAERSRPEHLVADDAGEQWADIEEMLRVGVDGGRPPAEVAAVVVDAVRDRRLFAFTDDAAVDNYTAHAASIVAEHRPGTA